MKRSIGAVLIAVFALGLSALGGCGKAVSAPSLGGETHWLEHCDGAAACGPGLECVCGLCTNPCSDDASCVGLDGAAICAERDATPYAGACSSAAPERLCVLAPGSALARTQAFPIEGLRYQSRGCFLPAEAAGAVEIAAPGAPPCKDVAAFAHDGEGKCWQFPSGCVPQGFQELTPAQAAAEACTSVDLLCPDALDCDDEHVATVEGCLSCEDTWRALDDRAAALKSGFDDSCTTAAECTYAGPISNCIGDCPVIANTNSSQNYVNDRFRLEEEYCWEPEKLAAKCGREPEQCAATVPLACIDGHCRPGISGPCAERDAANCTVDGQCKLVQAYRYGLSAQCHARDARDVACVDPGSYCEPPTHALDSAGICYLFAPGDCPPDGFRIPPDGDPCSSAPNVECTE